MLAMAASIGIKKGTPFQPDAKRAELLTAAVREGEATMNDYFMNRSFDPFWPNRQWVVTKPGNTFAFSYYGDGTLDYDRRAGCVRLLRDVDAEETGRSRQAARHLLLQQLPRQHGDTVPRRQPLSPAHAGRHAGA